MKNRVIYAILLFSALAFALPAQDFAFRVMATKGANEVKTGDTWQPIKGFMQIKLTDEIKVVDNGYLGLMHTKGSSLEVRQPGVYKAADLSARVAGGSSLMNKYADFLLSNNAEGKKNKLSATGAVHRGFGMDVYLPENQHSDIFANLVTVKWEPAKAGGPYVVTVTDMFGTEITKREVQEPMVQFDLTQPEFAKQDNLLIQLYAKSDPSTQSDSYLVKKLSKANRERVQALLADLNSGFQEDNALKHFVLASFFEEQKLFIDAIGAFERALKLAPDVDAYREAYEDFLLRNRLKDNK
jgi:tetratricopeptide (TPR) repeat protein